MNMTYEAKVSNYLRRLPNKGAMRDENTRSSSCVCDHALKLGVLHMIPGPSPSLTAAKVDLL